MATEVSALTRQLQAEAKSRAAIEQRQQLFESKLKEVEQQRSDAVDEARSLAEERDHYKGESDVETRKCLTLEADLKTRDTEIKELKAKLEALGAARTAEKREATSHIKTLEEQVKALKAKLSAETKQKDTAIELNKRLEADNSQLKAKKGEAETMARTLRTQVTELTREVSKLTNFQRAEASRGAALRRAQTHAASPNKSRTSRAASRASGASSDPQP
jgi:chromosome segregation ATPase